MRGLVCVKKSFSYTHINDAIFKAGVISIDKLTVKALSILMGLRELIVAMSTREKMI